MQASPPKSDRTAPTEIASSTLGEADADRDSRNASRVAQLIRPNQARNQNRGSQYVNPLTSERWYATADMEFMEASRSTNSRAAGCSLSGARSSRCYAVLDARSPFAVV
jgi:hypothetical protein